MNSDDDGGGSRTERKRREIIASAKAVFGREGFTHAGMEQIARDASVSTATLYAHFPSKADLFRIVVEETLTGIVSRVGEAAEEGADARARLISFGIAYAEFYSNPASRALFRMVVSERRRFPDLADHFRERGRNQLGGTAIRLIEELASEGALSIDKPSWAAGQLQGMLEHSTLILGLVAGDEVRPSRSIETIVEDCVATFLARYGVREKAA